MRTIKIGKNEAGQRMDKYLKKYFKEAGSGFLYKMLRKKNILLNGKKAEGKEVLTSGDEIQLYLADETIDKFRGLTGVQKEHEIAYPVCPLSIIYENEDCIFINKPAGMLSQKADEKEASLVEYLIGYLLQKGAITTEELKTFHPSVCNRLDRNTSGLVLCGKTLPGSQFLSRILKERNLEKYYICLVKNEIKEHNRVKAWLLKDEKTNQVTIFQEEKSGASYIETGYEPLWSNGKCTLLKVKLITGKTHQIRSHLASLGHPLAGDPKYGNKKWNQTLRETTGLKRQFLHAWEVSFPLSEGVGQSLSKQQFYAPLPKELQKVLQTFGCSLELDSKK